MNTPRIYPHVTVEHNHGVLELANAYFTREGGYSRIVGTCVGGGQTSRLFSATSYTPFKTGEEKSWYASEDRCYQTSTPGRFAVSSVFF